MAEKERRVFRRRPLALKVYWTTEGRAREEEAETGNVSQDGCFLLTSARASAGEEIDMRTQLPTGVWLHLQGAVAHRLDCGFGVRFRVMTEAAREALSGLLEENREMNERLNEGR